MSERSSYTYAVLRYVHDIASGEFMNVGVVLWAAQSCTLRAKFKPTYARLKGAFPTLDGEAFRNRIRSIQRAFDAIQSRTEGQLPFDCGRRIEDVIASVLPVDDSSLQWSPVGSGLSKELDATFAGLYARLVLKFEHSGSAERRKDEDVWREFKTSLEKRNLTKFLQPTVISSNDDEVRFEHAWKNGSWHCYEPLSLDLASSSSIKEKAHRWLGQLTSVREGAAEPFRVFFLLGKPHENDLLDAYRQAKQILMKAPDAEVVEEEQAEAFSERVADEIESHSQHVRAT